MASDWDRTTLDRLGRIITGRTPPSSVEECFGGVVPFITPSDFDGRRAIYSTGRYLTETGIQTVVTAWIPADAVMVSCIGSDMGKAALAGRDAVTNQQINSLVVDPPNDPHFVYYNLSSRRAEIRTAAAGSAQPILNKTAFGKLEIDLPPLHEQHCIAHILGTMDDKIELNRKMNETLEATARALFKSWFVDFDPVRAKAEGRDPGLPAHIAALFPDSFEDSELGDIPTGWSAGSLADFALLNPESWTKSTRPEIIQYVDLGNTKWGRIDSITQYASNDAPSRAQRILRGGDTIVGTVRPGNGSYALVTEDGLTGSTGFAVLRPQMSEYQEYVYLASTARDNIDALAHLADGGAYPAIRPEVVTETQVVRPPHEVVECFSMTVGTSLAKMAFNERESRTLAALRDSLLPKLISGELRIEDFPKRQGE